MSTRCYDFGDFNIEVIDDPKQSIDKSSVEPLTAECTNLTRDSFGSHDISKEIIRRHLFETSILVLGRDKLGRVFGYGSSKIVKVENFRIIHLQCIVISNEYKKKNLYRIFMPMRISEGVRAIKEENKKFNTDHILIGGRTQNPTVYRVLNKLIGLLPNPDGFIDERIKPVGKKFAKILYEEDCKYNNYIYKFNFINDTFITKSAYKTEQTESTGVNLYNSNIPFSDDEPTNNYMKENLDWANGDALIMLGFFNSERVQSLLKSAEQTISENGALKSSADSRLAG